MIWIGLAAGQALWEAEAWFAAGAWTEAALPQYARLVFPAGDWALSGSAARLQDKLTLSQQPQAQNIWFSLTFHRMVSVAAQEDKAQRGHCQQQHNRSH